MNIKDLINMSVKDAKVIFKKEKIEWRIASKDNSTPLLTSDFRPKRINLKVQGDLEFITDAYYG